MEIEDIMKHVKWHQDTDSLYEELKLSATMNIDVDLIVFGYRLHNTKAHIVIIIFPINRAQLHLEQWTLATQYYSRLQDHVTAKTLLIYLKEKHQWSE
eukprot:12881508-Ditylum_brightwellii.AAC.1